MRSDTEIRIKGMEALLKELGDVDAEKFIKLLIQEPFDYTRWQRDLWKEEDVEELSRKAEAHHKKLNQ